MIDLLNLEPVKISRDLKGKYLLFYGAPKSGKTSLAAACPKSLLLGFEHGYNDLPGIMAVDIPKWTAMREVLRELRKDEVKNKFDTIIVDTGTIAWERCEQHICVQNMVSEIGEIPWGRGFKACAKEFNGVFREISMLGYGIIFLAHCEDKQIPGAAEGETFSCPMLEKRAYRIINGMVDIIAYIDIDYETNKRFLQMRGTKHVVAGSRFEFMPDRIELSYSNLVNNLVMAIEKQGEKAGSNFITDERMEIMTGKPTRSFEESMNEARELWSKLTANNNEKNAKNILTILKQTFGEEKKFSEILPQQQELLELVVADMREM